MMQRGHSIQEAKKPKWYPVAESDVDVIGGDEAVRDVLDLRKAFLAATHLEEKTLVNYEIPFFGAGDIMARRTELVHEKRLPDGSFVCARNKRVHDVRIVAEDLLRPGKVFERVLAGWHKREQSCSVQHREHLEPLVAVRFEFTVEGRHVGLLRTGRRKHHEHLLRLSDCGGRHILHGGIVAVQNFLKRFEDALVVAGMLGLVEGIVARSEIAFEERENPDLLGDVRGEPYMRADKFVSRMRVSSSSIATPLHSCFHSRIHFLISCFCS